MANELKKILYHIKQNDSKNCNYFKVIKKSQYNTIFHMSKMNLNNKIFQNPQMNHGYPIFQIVVMKRRWREIISLHFLFFKR